MGQEVAVYFQDDTTGPELILSVLVGGSCTKLPVPRNFFVVAGPCKFVKVSLHRCSIKMNMCCWTWDGLLRRAEWIFLTPGVAYP